MASLCWELGGPELGYPVPFWCGHLDIIHWKGSRFIRSLKSGKHDLHIKSEDTQDVWSSEGSVAGEQSLCMLRVLLSCIRAMDCCKENILTSSFTQPQLLFNILYLCHGLNRILFT